MIPVKLTTKEIGFERNASEYTESVHLNGKMLSKDIQNSKVIGSNIFRRQAKEMRQKNASGSEPNQIIDEKKAIIISANDGSGKKP